MPLARQNFGDAVLRDVYIGVHVSTYGIIGAPAHGRKPAAGYRISPGSQVAMGGNSMTRARAMMLMNTKGMTPR